MKSGFVLFLLVAGLCMGCGGGAGTTDRPSLQYEDPFPVLSGYGNWIEVAGIGRVWQPPYQADWRPFTNGWWEWTDQGWMFDSDEPYGWVVYHYGDWARLGATGWVWVPGYEWSPARVHWYSGDDYVCWAPISPYRENFPGVYDPGYEDVWVIVPASRFTDARVGQFRTTAPLPRPGSVRTPYRERSPDLDLIQRATSRQIPQRRTEREDVGVGERKITRIRVRQESPSVPAPPPAVAPSPALRQPVAPTPRPPAASPGDHATPRPAPAPKSLPSIPQGRARQPGVGRTPAVERQPPAKQNDAEPKKAARPKRETGTGRDSVKVK